MVTVKTTAIILGRDVMNYDLMLKHTLPPEITSLPDVFTIYDDFFGKGAEPDTRYLFTTTLEYACVTLAETGQHLFLDALRKKWPKAVDAALPKAVDVTLQRIERLGLEVTAEGKAALATMSAKRKPARVAAMA